jgi:hypothetical protein
MPRKPEGDIALTGAERQRRYMERLRNASVTKPDEIEPDEDDEEEETDPKRIRAIYMARASACIDVSKFGYPGNVTDEIIEVADSVARAWSKLSQTLRLQQSSMADGAQRRRK